MALSRGAHPTTRRLIEYMIDAARDPLRYLGCYGVFHAPSTMRSEFEVVAQFQEFSDLYPYASAAFEAVSRHACLDYELGHGELALVQIAQAEGAPDGEGALAVLQGARGVAQCFRDIFDAIDSGVGYV